MTIATENGYAGAVYDPDGFEVTLPLISLSTIQSLISVWLPLQQNDVISMATYGIESQRLTVTRKRN